MAIQGTVRSGEGVFILLVGVLVGKGVGVLLNTTSKRTDAVWEGGERTRRNVVIMSGVVTLLALSSFWHLDMSQTHYHGPRWMGLWNNPNICGMLMSAGVVLSVGLLAAGLMTHRKPPMAKVLLLIAVFMMNVGLICSYSRGAWLGMSVGLLYLAWSYRKLKWQFVVLGVAVVVAVVFLFWHATPDNAPWFIKRMDLSRPSAQHRVAAWRASLQMMWDHPLGVGWNNAATIYEKNYSPPEEGAMAITTNDYLMLGAQLGWPGLICFVSYAGLCLRSPKSRVQSPESQARGQRKAVEGQQSASLLFARHSLPITEDEALRTACRAGVVSLLVAFWFDGGLFTLPTASVFWVLLEQGAYRERKIKSRELREKKLECTRE